MTDVPGTPSGTEFSGDRSPENGQQHISQASKYRADADGTQPYYKVEPSLEDVPTRRNQEESGTSKESLLPEEPAENPGENLFVIHKVIKDLSLQEASAEDMTFREVHGNLDSMTKMKAFDGHRLPGRAVKGEPSWHPWKQIPLSSSDLEASTQKERIIHQPLEQREDENTAYQAAEIEWLGFQKSSQVDILHSKCDEEPEVWDEEINEEDADDCSDDEDEVRVIEFKRKHREGFQLKEENHPSEDSPLSSPCSQPGTPDEQPMLGKKGDISRNVYSRYNTISYRKIRKGNTKQRIDEFESMMHL